jgi:sulfur carrier protein ThiS
MGVKYTKSYLEKIENLFAESDYILRYEKGNFKSGYCILNETSVVIVNKYYTTEGKINILLDILKELNFNPKSFASKKNQDFLGELQQTTLKL